MRSEALSQERRPDADAPPVPLVAVRNVSRSFGPRVLWDGLSFTVDRGQMLALTGRSGAGKSTLLNCLGLLDSVDGGEILIDGTDITGLSSRAARRVRRDVIGYLFQNYALMDNATVHANLDVCLSGGRGRLRGKGYDAVLERVGLAGRAKETVYRLSGGEQQRVALARLLVKRPSVVLADEPTGALDDENADMVFGVLRAMATDGCAVVVATHNQQVMRACDATLKI